MKTAGTEQTMRQTERLAQLWERRKMLVTLASEHRGKHQYHKADTLTHHRRIIEYAIATEIAWIERITGQEQTAQEGGEA